MKNQNAVALGKIGRSKNTEAQANASKENGKRGGRPAAQYYAVGNLGSGSEVFTFPSKNERDNFVAFGKADNRRAITSKNAKTYRDPVNI